MSNRDSDGRIHETTTEARAGSTPGVARNVLVIGTLLVVILFVVIVLVGRSERLAAAMPFSFDPDGADAQRMAATKRVGIQAI